MSDYPQILEIWDFGDVPKSEAAFREWLANIPADDPFHLELQTQLARTFSLRGQFDEAHQILDEIEPLISSSAAVKIRYLLERGRSYNSSKQPDKAMPLFVEAWEVGKSAELHYLAIDAAHMVAIAEPDPREQIKWHLKGIDLAEGTDQPDAKKWFGSLYNNLGWTYHDMGEYEKALSIFRKALAYREAQGHLPDILVAKYMIGRVLRSLERYQEALEIQEALLTEFEATGDEDGFVSEEIGECLLVMGRGDEAIPHFAKAYQLLKEISWVERERVERIKSLAEIM